MNNLLHFKETFTFGMLSTSLDLLFIMCILFGTCVIVSKNPIISVLFLIGLFLMVALYLMQIDIQFIGLSYLLVYVGAISILFLFILMLINVRVSELTTNNNNGVPLSLIAISIFSVVFTKLNLIGATRFDTKSISLDGSLNHDMAFLKGTITGKYTYWNNLLLETNSIYLPTSSSWDTTLSHTSHITSIGNVLYTSYPMLLIATSIILLLAMVGSIVITLKK